MVVYFGKSREKMEARMSSLIIKHMVQRSGEFSRWTSEAMARNLSREQIESSKQTQSEKSHHVFLES